MTEHDRLSSLILEHWNLYHPSMLEELRRQNRLEHVLEETAEQFADHLFRLISVEKMEYHQAWEMTVNEFLLPEEKPSSTRRKENHPEISASPIPTQSGWAARMKRRKTTSPPSGS